LNVNKTKQRERTRRRKESLFLSAIKKGEERDRKKRKHMRMWKVRYGGG
jgi:hypothetical protein